MSYNLKLPALQAKLKSMYSKMLTSSEYNELLLLNNLKDVTNMLKQKFPILEGLNENMHRKELEKELTNLYLFDSKKIYTFLTDKEKDFCDLYMEKLLTTIDGENDRDLLEKIYSKVQNNSTLKDLIGTEIDILNIIWIYRSKKFFNYDIDEIKEILTPVSYKLSNRDVRNIMELDSKYVIPAIENTKYSGIIKNEENIYYDFNKFLYKKNLRIFRNKNFDFAIVISYLNLLAFEIKNIINIIESVRYNSDKVELQARIIV